MTRLLRLLLAAAAMAAPLAAAPPELPFAVIPGPAGPVPFAVIGPADDGRGSALPPPLAGPAPRAAPGTRTAPERAPAAVQAPPVPSDRALAAARPRLRPASVDTGIPLRPRARPGAGAMPDDRASAPDRAAGTDPAAAVQPAPRLSADPPAAGAGA
ncbi:MAG: hypothetical protein ACK4TB_14355, partial [Gemmobacter sp.]